MEHGHDSPLQIDARWDGAVATVTVTGDLDITTAAALTRRLLAVAAGHPARLVLDLHELAFVDVAGAREAHEAMKHACGLGPARSEGEPQQMTWPQAGRIAALSLTTRGC